jgi:hypothetical protein
MKIALNEIHHPNNNNHHHHHQLNKQNTRRSLIPITQNHYHSKVDQEFNSKTTTPTNMLEKIEIKSLPKSSQSKLSVHNIEIDSNRSNNQKKVISHYDSMNPTKITKTNNVKRFDTFHAKNTTTTTTGVKYLSQLKKNQSQRNLNEASKPTHLKHALKQQEPDLKSQTILINNNNNNSKKSSLSQLTRESHGQNDSSLTSLMYSSLSSDSNYSLSSETSIISKIEETKTIFDLINSIKLYLKKIEVSYSVDNLFSFLKTHIKNVPPNPESKLTLDYLEQFKSEKNLNNNNTKLQQKTDPVSLPTSQLSVNYPVPLRSLSQLKPSVQQNLLNNNNNKKLINNTAKPIKKLFKHLNLFRCLYHIMQRDLIVNVFLLDKPKLSSNNNNNNVVTFMSTPKTDENLSTINENINSSINNNDTIKPSNNDMIQKAKLKINKKLRIYHEKIYNLNETLSLLINDTKNSDMKLLSKQSTLPVKYDYYKNGEFVLRLTIDIVKKFRLILNLCQKAYYLNHKLNENNSETTMRLNTILDSSDYEDDDDDLENENNDISNRCSKLDNEIKRDSSVLKAIQRKKTNLFQKLPTINSKSNNNSNKGTPSNLIETKQQQQQLRTSNNHTPALHESSPSPFRSRQHQHQQQPEVNLTEREKIIKNLTKQDSIDSFIRETDTSSFLSETDDSYYPIQNNAKEDDYNEDSNYLKEKVSSINSMENPDNMLEEYRVYKQKLDISQSTLKNLNFYLDNLIQRVDRYNYLEMQLKNDNELIKRTEISLKQYQIDNMIEMNNNNSNNKTNINNNNNNNNVGNSLVYVTKNSLAINLAFRKQLERQLDFLKYRFKLNLQDFNVEKVCLPEINYAIMDTEKKIANLNYYVNDLNKYLIYIETRLSEQFLQLQLKQQKQQQQQQLQKAQLKKPVSLARHSSIPAKSNFYK